MTFCIKLPLRLESEPNKRGHWSGKARRTKALRAAMIALPANLPIPCVVTITRIAPRSLDDDNMVGAGKGLRDGIADRLGIDDRDPRVRWVYSQERGRPKEYAVRIQVVPA